MTAGRGIIHSEMPEQEEGRMAGFQLWVNLAAADKMTAPAYRDIAPDAVPQYTDAPACAFASSPARATARRAR
jgi:redox-sensitive bicupin YhaK (pirin superfamily)